MTTEAQKKARNKYNRDNLLVKSVSLNRNTEADLIEWLSDKSFGPYIKELIRSDMETSKKDQEK